jgi:hypothetical protein
MTRLPRSRKVGQIQFSGAVDTANAGAARSYIYNHSPVTEHLAIAAEADAKAAKRGTRGSPRRLSSGSRHAGSHEHAPGVKRGATI